MPAVESSPRSCPGCGRPLPREFKRPLCPACLLLPEFSSDATEARDSGSPSTSHYLPPEEIRAYFPGLEIGDLIGAGGMGSVYKARQPRLNRLVALKILSCPAGSPTDFAIRFEREAQVMARLNHPNIVGIYDFGEVERTGAGQEKLFFLLMEYVDGTDLHRLIRAGSLGGDEALALIAQICEALQFAHDEGITHRDIKPANLLIDRKGKVKVADFGLAKLLRGDETLAMGLTMTGMAMGTPHYMAPEQWEAPETVDHRADIYSLGVVIYELLTGERPIGIASPPSGKCSVDPRIDMIVLRAMEREPGRRYQRVADVKEGVTRVLDHPAKKTRVWSRALPGAAGAVLIVLVGVSMMWGQWRKEALTGLSAPADTTSSDFPVGKWTRPFRQISDLHKNWTDAGATWNDGWISPGQKLNKTITLAAPNGGGRNWGVRATYRWNSEGAAQLLLRRDKRAGDVSVTAYFLAVDSDGVKCTRIEADGKKITLGEAAAGPFAGGDEVPVEAYVIGDMLFGRVDGKVLLFPLDGILLEGNFEASARQMSYRDIEFIKLDGLSEDEALEIIGLTATSPKPEEATGDRPYQNILGMKFVPVPGTDVLF